MRSPTYSPRATPAFDWRPRLSVVLPTYKESGNIERLIQAVREAAKAASELEILVVDDDSPDGTAEIAASSGSDVRVIVRKEARGLATAVRRGIEEAKGEVVVVMDTDFNHQPEMIPQMVDFLRFYDLVTGSRFTVGGGMEEHGRYRLSFLFNFFCRMLLGTKLQDHLSGFFAARRATVLALDLDDIFEGYGDYFIRLLVESLAHGSTVLEIPVYYPARSHGESKTKFMRTLGQYTRAVVRLALRRRAQPARSAAP
jgi:dolichol-phosphate mannosyltransferase